MCTSGGLAKRKKSPQGPCQPVMYTQSLPKCPCHRRAPIVTVIKKTMAAHRAGKYVTGLGIVPAVR